MLKKLNLKLTPSSIILIITNLIPLIGVLLGAYTTYSILIIYWLESGVIALYTILKIVISGINFILKAENLVLKIINIFFTIIIIPFFMFHFGMFMFVHLVFINILSSIASASHFNGILNYNLVLDIIKNMLIPLIGLIISHGFSFIFNYIGNKEYDNTRKSYELMTTPYKRIFVMQIAIIFGGWLIILTKAPQFLVIVLCLIKIYIDLKAHNKEHKIL